MDLKVWTERLEEATDAQANLQKRMDVLGNILDSMDEKISLTIKVLLVQFTYETVHNSIRTRQTVRIILWKRAFLILQIILILRPCNRQ